MKRLPALLLSAVLILASAGTAWAFTDTAELSETEQMALQKMGDMEVIGGYPDGSFRPQNPVSRAEFAKMLCIFAGREQLLDEETVYIDVLPQAWYAGWVKRVAQQEWITGYPGREYRPQAQITQQEIATVLVRVAGLGQANFAWPQDYIAAAEAAGFFKEINFQAIEPASRVVTCQMLYNALPSEQEKKLTATKTLRGVVTAINGQEITVLDAAGNSAAYVVGALLPGNLFPGAYVEAQIADKYLLEVEQVFNAQKKNAYWDIALDGKSAQIDGKKYNIEEAEIFVVSYTLSKPYSTETFVMASLIDRSMLSLGGRLAAEMAVVLAEDNGVLQRAYLVNASVVISGGRLDVVEGAYSSAKGDGISFMGRGVGLPLIDGVSMPKAGSFIHYNLKNGAISSCSELYTANAGLLPDVSQILSGGGEDAPYAWVNAQGQPYAGSIDVLKDGLPRIISNKQGTVRLGTGENSSPFFLAEGCLIYEVKGWEISNGSKSSLEQGRFVVALTNPYSEICYIFCLMN